MRSRIVLLLSLALSLALPGASARVASEPYVGGAGLVTTASVSCGANVFNVNGVCFPLDGTEANVDLDIADLTGLPVGAYFEFWALDPDMPALGTPLGGGAFCDATSAGVPGGANALIVYLEPVDALLVNAEVCFAATTGAVTASFS